MNGTSAIGTKGTVQGLSRAYTPMQWFVLTSTSLFFIWLFGGAFIPVYIFRHYGLTLAMCITAIVWAITWLVAITICFCGLAKRG